ncbi:MAG: hypothetical protein QOJ03_2285, partial [Frankiaceae bacterium]|nr:hypothetical protein [Frankiaceae bacterium]
MRLSRWSLGVTVLVAGVAGLLLPATGQASGPRVLRVGSWHGIKGTFTSIQAAVDAAGPGD